MFVLAKIVGIFICLTGDKFSVLCHKPSNDSSANSF